MDYQQLHLLLRYGKEFCHSKIRQKGFTDTEHTICSYVYVHENCSQDDIARQFRMDKTTVGKALEVLESKGYLTRTQSVQDRRKKALQLTEAGKASISEILRINDEWLGSVLSALNDSEQCQFEACLEKLLTSAQKIYETREETPHESRKASGLL